MTASHDAAVGVAAAKRVQSQATSSSWRHADVVDAGLTSDLVTVRIDGNTDATPALNRSGQALRPDTRVLVVQPATGATYVLAVAPRQGAYPFRVELTGPPVPLLDDTLTTLPVDTIVGDTDLVTIDGDDLTVALDGVYDLDVMAVYDAQITPAGNRYVEFYRNGTDRIEGPETRATSAGADHRMAWRTTAALAAGDTVRVRGRHSQGSTIDGTAERLVIMYLGG